MFEVQSICPAEFVPCMHPVVWLCKFDPSVAHGMFLGGAGQRHWLRPCLLYQDICAGREPVQILC